MQTWGYWDTPALPERVTIDGQEYRRIERLARNLRPGDLLALGDATDRAQYHRAYVIVTGVDTWPQSFNGMRRYPPTCVVHFKLRPCDDSWRWRSWGFRETFREDETKRPVTWAYRAVS